MDHAQLAMTQLLHDADERARQIRDHYRGRVHEWFEGLTIEQKQKLGRFMPKPSRIRVRGSRCAPAPQAGPLQGRFFFGQLWTRRYRTVQADI
jgi:hypothetical protein